MEERTAVLLGAGASRDAGLPLTQELALNLLKSFDDELSTMNDYMRQRQQPVVRALEVIYAAMISHATEQGGSPLSAVNVERLVSAIRLLRDRRTHEAAPFITSWRPSLENVDAHPLAITDSDLRKHFTLDSNFDFRLDGLASKVADIARSISAPGDGSVFRALEDQVLRRICVLLAKPVDVSYLDPLVDLALEQPGGLDITTLNYDLTVEIAAQARGVEVDTGLGRWIPGSPLTFESTDRRLNLIKPHGSIDWARVSSSNSHRLEGHPLMRYRYRTGVVPKPHPSADEPMQPLIVIGDREKLETEGPTLELIRAFEDSMRRASHLLVVGYSFGDEHVNTIIRNWMNTNPTRTVGIVDPGWPTHRMVIDGSPLPTFRDALLYTAGIALTASPGRIVVVQKGARAGLAEAVQARPLNRLESLLSLDVNYVADQAHITITNPGYTISEVKVSAWPEWQRNPLQPTAALDACDGTWVSELRLPDLEPGASHVVSVDLSREPRPVRLDIAGRSWAYNVRERVELETAEPSGTVDDI
ncbi:SIR2 family protein [Microbacterium sp. LWO13-1.2]|uniref:SIR2 family protein n=1 Tax=Microbacterium sp. LWO13-1.2 TaxID=3135262 RepID=UPI003139DDB2